MSEQDFGDLYVEYILGELDEKRAAEMARHLDECPECRQNVSELEETLHSLPLSLAPQSPPPELKARILREIESRGEPLPFPAPTAAAPTPLWKGWAIAATVLLAVAAAASFRLYQEGQRQGALIASLQSEADQLRQARESLQLRVRDLTAPDTKFLNLAGLAGFEGVSGSAFLRAESQTAAVYFHSLPALAEDRAYQLWVIQKGVPPHPSNVFKPEGETTELQVNLPVEASQVAVLAVTIEPLGGSPQPTGSMVAAGQFVALGG